MSDNNLGLHGLLIKLKASLPMHHTPKGFSTTFAAAAHPERMYLDAVIIA
jgi:hypothetical protein